jgi:hypothetical protein
MSGAKKATVAGREVAAQASKATSAKANGAAATVAKATGAAEPSSPGR